MTSPNPPKSPRPKSFMLRHFYSFLKLLTLGVAFSSTTLMVLVLIVLNVYPSHSIVLYEYIPIVRETEVVVFTLGLVGVLWLLIGYVRQPVH